MSEISIAVDEAPKGMIARGHYTAKSKFLDDDKNIYLDITYIAARNIRISLEKRLSESKATRKLHEGKYDIRDKKLPRTVLVNCSNYSRARRPPGVTI